MKIKQDRRVERTKRDLKEAFLTLIEKRENIHSVTITDISALANYNRATFYAHYSDKLSLLEEIKEEALMGFIESFQEPYKDKLKILHIQQLESNAIKIFKYVENNASLFTLLFNSNLFPGFQQQIGNAIENIFELDMEFGGEYFQAVNEKLYSRVEAYALIGMLDFWIKSSFSYSAEYMTEQLIRRILHSPIIIKIKTDGSE